MIVHVAFDLDVRATLGLLFALTVITLLVRQLVREIRNTKLGD